MTAAKIPGGYILLARKLLDSGIMEKPPLFLKMWIWMLLQASHRDRGDLKRGQFFTSIDRMREVFSYKVGFRVERPTVKEIRAAYDSLAKGMMIGTMKVTHGMIITIINYEIYQNYKNYEGHNEGHGEGTKQGTILTMNGNKENIYSQNSLEVLAYLNKKTVKRYRNAKHIEARIKGGATVEDCKRVIDTKLRDPYFIENPKYLNPETLFRPGNFDKYLNEPPSSDKSIPQDSSCPRCGAQIPPQDRTLDGCIHCEEKAQARV